MDKLIYKPNFNSKEYFMAYKFALMPQCVFGNENLKTSYPYLFMNNEFLNVLEMNIDKDTFYKLITPEILLDIKKIIKESIEFNSSFNYASQAFSRKYKNTKIKIDKAKYLNNSYDLYFAKYLCFKEAYDLELDVNKIIAYNTEKANKIIEAINQIISPLYSEKLANSIRKNVINDLKEDTLKDNISTTLENGYSLYNINNFKAFVCSNDIMKYVGILYDQDKLSSDSIDFSIEVLNYSIFAKNRTLVFQKAFILDEDDIDTFDRDTALNLKNLLVCKKYKKTLAKSR